ADQQATKKTLNRYNELLKKKLTSQQDYDDADSANLQALAEVAIRQAELDNANILLSYTKIKAPISGRIGISQVSEGALITAQQANNLVTIVQSDQVYVDMTQSSVVLYAQQKEFNRNDKKGKTRPVVPVKITLEDGTAYDQTGYLEFSDVQVSDSTGSVTLRALVPNAEHTLLPGMFVRAHISSPEEREYIVLPQSVVVRSQSGEPSAYIVNSENITEKKTLLLGDEVENGWVVQEGLNVGDKVVISNLSKIKNNQNVVIDSEQRADKTQATAETTH
ncbi:MAG: efflux RND transporter periplasmic adaptor subunit, partial [Psychromonas sp.]